MGGWLVDASKARTVVQNSLRYSLTLPTSLGGTWSTVKRTNLAVPVHHLFKS